MTTTSAEAGYQRLYHYQPFNDYLSSALEGKFYFSNPRNFNDPWDCNPAYDVRRVNDPAYQAECIDKLQKHLPALKTSLRSGPDPLSGLIHSATTAARNTIADHWRVYCLTPHCDSILMWSHYSDRHHGICLEFDVANPTIGGAYKVMYHQESPVLDLLSIASNDVVQVLWNKADVWRYEDEYRIIGHDGEVSSGKPKFLPITNQSFLSLSPGVLTSVIAGCQADFDSIKTFVAKHAPGLPVKRIIRDDYQFNLRVEG